MPPRHAGDISHDEEVTDLIKQWLRAVDERNRIIEGKFDTHARSLEIIANKLNGNGKDKISIPAWVMPMLFTVLCAFMVFVYNAIERRADAADSDLRAWKAYTINLTIELNKRGIPTAPLPETQK